MLTLRLGARWMHEEFWALLDDMRSVEGKPITDDAWETITSNMDLREALQAVQKHEERKTVWLIKVTPQAALMLRTYFRGSIYSMREGLGGTPEENNADHQRWVRGMRSLHKQLVQAGIEIEQEAGQ